MTAIPNRWVAHSRSPHCCDIEPRPERWGARETRQAHPERRSVLKSQREARANFRNAGTSRNDE